MNWQASFGTPPHVRAEWATQHGLPDIASGKFDHALNAVRTRLGVTIGAWPCCSTQCSVLHSEGCKLWKGADSIGEVQDTSSADTASLAMGGLELDIDRGCRSFLDPGLG